MQFLEKVIHTLVEETQDLGEYSLVLPGKRPIVFIKKIIQEMGYTGFLPTFITIEELHAQIAKSIPVEGVALWLVAYDVYREYFQNHDENFSAFIKWYPTLQKDWDDILKHGQQDLKVLEYLYDEERIKNWAENLGNISPDSPRKKYLNFWKKAHQFLPLLKKKLKEKNWATPGMIHQDATEHMANFVENTKEKWVFCGLNALTPLEEKLIRALLQQDKARAFFHADAYYMNDPKQEAGHFLRNINRWPEFGAHRLFSWIENDFEREKNIQIVECPGNIAQTQYLRKYLNNGIDEDDTAIVLMDENLLPATLDAVSAASSVNITMGYPLKNLSFSNAIKSVFHLQKQLTKNPKSYYYNDVLSVIEGLSFSEEEIEKGRIFKSELERKNKVYIKPDFLHHHFNDAPFYPLLLAHDSEKTLLQHLLDYIKSAKEKTQDNAILFENISVFERVLTTLLNWMSSVTFRIEVEAIEQLLAQLFNAESLNFEGEPLEGLQIMGLLETRLLNFKNIILLSTNEGKIPAAVTQNSFIPYEVRKHFNLYTFQEHDAIFAYHFYRLLQGAENIVLLYNSIPSGLNTGEKSRFITQIAYETRHLHKIEEIWIDSSSVHLEQREIIVEKTPAVMEKLHLWKKNVSASSLNNYIYNPYQFYLSKVLGANEVTEISEELSNRAYGTLIHNILETLYTPLCGRVLNENDLSFTQSQIDKAIEKAILNQKHELDFYSRGINYIHKALAEKTTKAIIEYDLNQIKNGHRLKIIALEKRFSALYFPLYDDASDAVYFQGSIDRIDVLDDTLRVIDYKSGKVSNPLHFNIKPDQINTHFSNQNHTQSLQLLIYLLALPHILEENYPDIKAGLWSLTSVKKGVHYMNYDENTIQDAVQALRALLLEILNPDIPFIAQSEKRYG